MLQFSQTNVRLSLRTHSMAFFIYKHFFKKKLKLLFMISFHSTCFANVRVLRIYPAYEPYHLLIYTADKCQNCHALH